ncbi:MAG: chemotaxis protein CheW [Candidatus Dormibacteraeota bacterium]|nr:chemotaxis protein CheW [Candidatus Dormibacteraeota bacterium]
MKVIVLPVGEEHYAFPLDSVQQVISGPRVTRLPVSDTTLLGLVNVRGEIVPLFDLAALTGTGDTGASDFAILVETSRGPAALGVAVMPQSAEIDEATASEGPADEPSVYPLEGRLVTLLEIEILLVKGRAGLSRAS